MAFVIAETMPGLCYLDIKGHELSDVGLLPFLINVLFLNLLT